MKTFCTSFSYAFIVFLTVLNLHADAQITTLGYTGTIQTYHVPAGVTSIGIGVVGGSGGSNTGGGSFTGVLGGYAASMYGIFTVTPGQTLKVLVGGAGQTVTNCGGGGGGSFVWDSATSTLLIAAGGGGGAGNNDFATGIPGLNANTGDIAINGNTMPSGAGSGGGGGVSNGAYDYGAAGAGWLSSGHAGYNPTCTNATSGATPLAGGAGGSYGGEPGEDGNGGFGGGGGGQGRCDAVGAGGGGGYSGGGAGGELTEADNIFQSGGGGGSYNLGSDQDNSIATDTGNGAAEIKICPTASGISSTAGTSFCIGASTTLSSNATGGLWSGYGGVIVTPAGTATGASSGTAVISYKVSGCPDVSIAVTVDPSPAKGTIAGSDMLCPGYTTALLESVSGGVWSSSNTAVATIDGSSGTVGGVSSGTINITYSVTDPTTGCTSILLFPLEITPPCNEGVSTIANKGGSGISVYPNPNTGTFRLLVSTVANEQATVTITNVVGVKVKEFTTQTNTPGDIQLDTPPGIYFLGAATANGRWSEKIVVTQ